MDLAIKRYGEFFLRYYADEVKRNLNQDDLMDCPAALLDKSEASFQLSPSFYVTIIKYQWGIIKDFQGVSVDPLNKSIAYHMQLENLFDFLFDQAQQLFVFTSTLNAILNDEETFISGFSTDADTLIAIYTELMNHLDRLCTGLNNSYDILAQEATNNKSIDRPQQMKLKQLTKVYILLLTFSVCSIQLSLTGPLQITTAPSISAVLEITFPNQISLHPSKIAPSWRISVRNSMFILSILSRIIQWFVGFRWQCFRICNGGTQSYRVEYGRQLEYSQFLYFNVGAVVTTVHLDNSSHLAICVR